MSDKIDRLVESFLPEASEKFAGWIAFYNGKQFEIDKSQAKDLYGAKQIAIKHFKAPKSKQHMITVKPGYDD
jgi:hypothetical protein